MEVDKIPKYTGVWDRGSMWHGDTLLGFSMLIVDKDTDVAVVPAEVCAFGLLMGH